VVQEVPVSSVLPPSRRPWWIIATFVVLTVALAVVGLTVVRNQWAWLMDVTRRATTSSTTARAKDLLAWRESRLSEAAAIQANRQVLTRSLASPATAPDDDGLRAWNQVLAIVLARRDYTGAALFNETGQFRRPVGTIACGGSDRGREIVSVAQRSRRVEMSDPFSCVDGSVHMVVAIPLVDKGEPTPELPTVLVLEIDPRREMEAVLRGRALVSSANEVLLVRRQPDGVIVLAGVRGALTLSVGTLVPSRSRDDMPGRVARGEEGTFDAPTLAGVPALCVAKKVGDTGWWVVSLVPIDGVLSQPTISPWRVAMVVGLLVLSSGAILLLVWTRGQAALFRRLYEAEAGRQRLAESFGHVTRFANDIIVMADEQGRIVEANDRAIEAYGYAREELIGLSLAALRAPDLQGATVSDLQQLKALGTFAYQADHVRKDGTRFPVELRARYFTEHGRSYFHGVIRDVTERVALEHNLRDSAETYRILFEQANDAIVVADADTGVILDVNQKTAALTGRPADELRGLHHTTLHPPDRDAGSRTNFRARVAGSKFETMRTELQHVSGRRVPVEVNASRIDIRGRQAVLGVFRDLTERLAREEELRASEARRQKLESLALLAGGIAHDFNNLLTGILGNISLARFGLPPGTESGTCLTEAERASLRAKDLTQQLLTFSRGGAPIKKVVDLIALLRDTATFACRGTAVALEIRPAAGPIFAEVDEGQIAQVINNIALNAVQAMPAGGTLTVAADVVTFDEVNPHKLPAGRFARLTLADTGTGIPPELIARVFDPYFTTKQQGSGLGLAISDSIVSRHGGHLGVRSRLGAGAEFEILVPAREAAADRAAPPAPDTPVLAGKILIMDDEVQVRELGVRMITRLGLSAEAVAAGHEALEAYRAAREVGRPFDAVLMDLTISGGMGGKETVAALLAYDPKARVIVSSGYSNDPIMGDFKDYGFSAVLAKPYRLDELRAVLAAVMGNPGSGSASTPDSA
jgi:PAS domain S-box-containing protein